MATAKEILDQLYAEATKDLSVAAVKDQPILERIDFVCRCLSNRAGVRLLNQSDFSVFSRFLVLCVFDPCVHFRTVSAGRLAREKCDAESCRKSTSVKNLRASWIGHNNCLGNEVNW